MTRRTHNLAALALELRNSGREARLHQLGAAAREWLHSGALLHGMGVFLACNSHHAHTYYIISNAGLLGFDQTEVAIIAMTALFHRKAFAAPKRPEFAALDPRAQRIVRTLSGLLRMAENMKRGHTNVARHAHLRVVSSKKTTLAVHAARECRLELWGVQSN